MDLEQAQEWRIFIARPESLGGRMLRRHLARQGLAYECWPEPGAQLPAAGAVQRGLLLPLAGPLSAVEPWGQEARLAELQRLLRSAQEAGLERTVVMLPEPDKAVFALCAAFAQGGLCCTAICAATGEIFGGERPYDPAGTVEELLDTFGKAARLGKKRVQLPCREDAPLGLIHWEDLAAAALFALRSDRETPPLFVRGLAAPYGDLARLAAKVASFGGGIRYGRKLCRPLPPLSALPPMREMASANRLRLDLIFPHLLQAREKGGVLKLSACVIMRDNEEDIGRCLESLKAADELIVVDTGSKDKSVEIARRYTDKVSHFTWVDDFAAAKNYALSQATGDWIVFLDSDESFTAETAPGLKYVCEDYDMPAGMESVVVRLLNVDLTGAPLPGQAEGAVTRFLKAGQHFEGVVHENPRLPNGRPPTSANLPRERGLLLHTGYAPERRLEKKARNEALIRNAEATGKEVPFADYYHARIAYNDHEWERAREAAMAMIDHGEPVGTMRFETYRIWYRSCQRLEDEAGLLEARAAMRRDMPDMPDSWALEGVDFWNAGKEEEGAPLLLKALELSHEFLQKNPAEQDDIAADTAVIARELARFYEDKGETERAAYVRGLAGI